MDFHQIPSSDALLLYRNFANNMETPFAVKYVLMLHGKKILPSVIFLCDSRYLGMEYSYRNNTGTRTIRRCFFCLEFNVNAYQFLNLKSTERRIK